MNLPHTCRRDVNILQDAAHRMPRQGRRMGTVMHAWVAHLGRALWWQHNRSKTGLKRELLLVVRSWGLVE